MKTQLAKFICGLAVLGAATAATAQVTSAVSNLGTPGQFVYVYNGQWIAKEFTTGASATNLNSVDLEVQIAGAPAGFGVSLFDNVSGQPGTSLVTLTGPTPSALTYADYIYAAPANTILSANTSYWLVLSATAAPDFSNAFEVGRLPSSDTSYSGLSDWSLTPGDAGSGNQGSSWNVYPSDNNPMIQVNIGEVPEPATLTLSTMGGLGWWLLLRRRK
ncbi:MAG: choice-of-anchor R domain-containing protein [Limisphaerales bacterium]